MNQVVLKYRHKGQAKMVAKLFQLPGYAKAWIALHEESGSQTLVLFDAPGGVDVVVAQWLYQEGVSQWHHCVRGAEDQSPGLYVADIKTILAKGIEKHWDGRHRLFLPRDQWDAYPGLFYKVPWVRAEKIIDQRDLKSDTVAEFAPPEPPEQLGLL